MHTSCGFSPHQNKPYIQKEFSTKGGSFCNVDNVVAMNDIKFIIFAYPDTFSSSVSSRERESALLYLIPGLCTGVKVYYCSSSTQLSTIYYKVFKFSGALYY